MRAITFVRERELSFETVPDPTIEQPTDALVRVQRTAICGSDLHVYLGRERGLDAGTVMGHEFVGEIVALGGECGKLTVGDRVLCPFTTSCGECRQCRSALTARCERGQLFGWVAAGRGLHGAQAELVRVPLASGTLVAIPEGVSDDVALLLGDVLTTGYYCAKRADLTPDGTHVVLGCGPVGLMAVVGAGELGARRILAVDRIPERLKLAETFGAETIDYGKTDAVARVMELTSGLGADTVMEAVGSPQATRLAVDLVRPGGTISVVGVHCEQSFAFSPIEAYDKNLTYRIGRCPARALLDELLPLARSGRHDFSAIFSHRLPLSQGIRAYEMFDSKSDGCTKAILDPGN